MLVNLGSGPEKIVTSNGKTYVRVDSNPAHHPDVCMDVIQYVRRLKKDSVTQFRCANILGALTGIEIFRLFNEMHRTLKFGGLLYVEQMLVHYESGEFNAKAWTTPLDKTHWSMHMLNCFQSQATQKYRGVKPWKILDRDITVDGVMKAYLEPKVEAGYEEKTFERWVRAVTGN